ncbi:MAG: tRNA (cytidine(34)-2'-O)-methyltransferase [Deltaproteobacteria bacterium]|nr:tRNA (cytidine(34)-2'-O)-methyltransferase [Deltaproteobacteria bacterium]
MFNVVLVNPEIPPNTGNIGRLCVAVGARLHLIKPLGFHIDDKHLKRAGLDYWQKLDLVIWESLDHYLRSVVPGRIVLTGSKRGRLYYQVEFKAWDHILFGPETSGLTGDLFDQFPSRIARIPINLQKTRSLNLSTAAGIIVFEGLRQLNVVPGSGSQ